MSDAIYYEEIANRIRRRIVDTIHRAKVGHAGGSLSAVEILIALYFEVLRFDPAAPRSRGRDIFILSKGHAASALYSVLVERGLLEEGLLGTFGRIDSRLQVHPDMHKVDWVEISTGALGQGLSVGVGAALGARLDGSPARTYVLLGDGECQEGQVWEAAMAAAHYRLDNLVAVIDYNQAQLFGKVAEIMDVAPLAEKWRSFGWAVQEVDGHSLPGLLQAFKEAEQVRKRPVAIVARTMKGKGVSFMEQGGAAWHGRVPTDEEYRLAMAELGGDL